VYREKQREYDATYNVKHGRVQNPGARRKHEPAARLSIGPFTRWLRTTFASHAEAYTATGIDDSAMIRYYNGTQPFVSIETVEKALIAMGGNLNELYPLDA